MTSFRNILVLVLSLIMMAASCTKDDSTSPSLPIDGDVEYVSVPLSITVGIASTDGSIVKAGGKQTFSAGDAIVISNPDVLYEPLTIFTDGNEGKQSANFAVELKVRKDAELVSGITKLSAVLKNGDHYNHGRQFVDVKKISSLAEGLEKYGCWSCDGFTYSADGNAVMLEQSTVFLYLNLFRTTVSMHYGVADYSEIVDGECLYALPSGTIVECNSLNINQRLDAKERSLYRIEYPAPGQCLSWCFSVGEGKYVFFSKGNLQYRPMDGSWRIAPQQYHSCFDVDELTYVGENYSEWMGEDNWTDVFRWGAIMEGGSPGQTNADDDDYTAFVDDNNKMKGVCAYGAEWTILDNEEWNYLLEERPDALQKRGGALVGSIFGWVILPDEWSTPEGVAPFVGQYNVRRLKDIPNNYTIEEWSKMESAGAVFLPETGSIVKITTTEPIYLHLKEVVSDVGCHYHSLSYDGTDLRGGFYIEFDYSSVDSKWKFIRGSRPYYYRPVRLVQKLDDSFIKTN